MYIFQYSLTKRTWLCEKTIFELVDSYRHLAIGILGKCLWAWANLEWTSFVRLPYAAVVCRRRVSPIFLLVTKSYTPIELLAIYLCIDLHYTCNYLLSMYWFTYLLLSFDHAQPSEQNVLFSTNDKLEIVQLLVCGENQ